MNGDIRPPRRPTPPPEPPRQSDATLPPVGPNPSQPIDLSQLSHDNQQDTVDSPRTPQKPVKRKWLSALLILLVLAVVLAVSAVSWYWLSLRPVQSGVVDKVEFTIASGMTPGQIAGVLDENGLIRSQLAFDIYTRLNDARGNLQAGQYRLAPTEDLPSIVAALQKGGDSQFTITFYPGATLYDPTDTPAEKRTDVFTMLTRAGYSEAEVEAALDKQYDHPLLVDKPAEATLEGYVYGETYTFGSSATVEQVLTHTFDTFYQQIEDRDIVAKAARQDMSLHEAIILGSIIEREVGSQPSDQRQVSQIFHRRLDQGEMLGADATFMYVANQRDIEPRTDIESTYNTRQVAGLPPGPIAVPGITALEAAVDPAKGDYLYFVSGDDGKTHFARTQAEHDANTAKYCTTLCQIP